jgi:hypothetical protein
MVFTRGGYTALPVNSELQTFPFGIRARDEQPAREASAA